MNQNRKVINGIPCGKNHKDQWLPFSLIFSENVYGNLQPRLDTWCKLHSQVAAWVPKDELSAYWAEVSRLNVQQIKMLVEASNYEGLISPLVEARLVAENSRMVNQALEAGLRRVW